MSYVYRQNSMSGDNFDLIKVTISQNLTSQRFTLASLAFRALTSPTKSRSGSRMSSSLSVEQVGSSSNASRPSTNYFAQRNSNEVKGCSGINLQQSHTCLSCLKEENLRYFGTNRNERPCKMFWNSSGMNIMQIFFASRRKIQPNSKRRWRD